MSNVKKKLIDSYVLIGLGLLSAFIFAAELYFYRTHLLSTLPFTITPVTPDPNLTHEIYYSHPKSNTSTGFFHKACSCWKNVERKSTSAIHKSACSDESTFLGSSQQVMSFELYNFTQQKTKYNTGHYPYLTRIRKFFPGFFMRIYSDYKLTPNDEYCYFLCTNDDVVWCDMKRIPDSEMKIKKLPGRCWRYLALLDPLVDLLIMGDISNRMGITEASIIAHWSTFLDEKISPWVNVSGGEMWGAKTKLLDFDERKTVFDKMMEKCKLNLEFTLTDDDL